MKIPALVGFHSTGERQTGGPDCAKASGRVCWAAHTGDGICLVTLGLPSGQGSSELLGALSWWGSTCPPIMPLWHTRCLEPPEASPAWAFLVHWHFSQQPEQAWHIAVV